MHEFKVGDRVVIGPENGGYDVSRDHGLFPGNTGTVTLVRSTGRGEVYGVRTDNAPEPLNSSGRGWAFFAHEILPEPQA